MRKLRYLLVLVTISLTATAQRASDKALAAKILQDTRLDTVQHRARRLLTGFTAGTSYGEVWIRDFNTFIIGSLQNHQEAKVRDLLLAFFRFQGKDGNIVDGYIPDAKADRSYMPDRFIYSDLMPGYAANKNTVETDQESSLVQAVRKYVDYTHDAAILQEQVGGSSALARLEAALNFVLTKRWSAKYGLVIGATTVDWGDVQPDTSSIGVELNKQTKWAIDVYDNAMFYLAINDFLHLAPQNHPTRAKWTVVAAQLKQHVRQHLWQGGQQKYQPHVYLNGSPFSASFREDALLYSGGSACAILAGLNTVAEIKEINRQLVAAAAREPHATIGITVYPPYPAKEFPNMAPYKYQNAGDWTWFGGRFIQALTKYDLVAEAYAELNPMLERTLANNGFHEWYDVRTGAPKGSGEFRGEAGVLLEAITQLRTWAKAHQ